MIALQAWGNVFSPDVFFASVFFAGVFFAGVFSNFFDGPNHCLEIARGGDGGGFGRTPWREGDRPFEIDRFFLFRASIS